LPLQLATALEPRLLELVFASELAELRVNADPEFAEPRRAAPRRWGDGPSP
jgi:hypothetical protein